MVINLKRKGKHWQTKAVIVRSELQTVFLDTDTFQAPLQDSFFFLQLILRPAEHQAPDNGRGAW